MKEYKVIERMTDYGGWQKVYRFPNGFGASVVNGAILHMYPFYSEIAVIKFDDDVSNEKFHLTYDTYITDDVIVVMNIDDELSYLKRIKALNKEGK